MRQNAFEKTYLGEMLIEQIIEFESKVPGPLVVHIYILKPGYFHDKTKFFKDKYSKTSNIREHYLMLKMLQKAIYLDFPDLSQVTKFNPKNARF